MQRALMPFFKPEDDFMEREVLLGAGRGDLIGNGCDCLIPVYPPEEALRARMKKANQSLGEGKYVHQIPNPEPTEGYPPGQQSAQKRQGNKKGRGQ